MSTSPTRRKATAVVGALVVLAVGAFIALACLWLSAWDWQGTTTSPKDRRSLYIGAATATGAAVIVAAATLFAGFRKPK